MGASAHEVKAGDLVLVCQRVKFNRLTVAKLIVLRCDWCRHAVDGTDSIRENQGKPGTHVICHECVALVTPGSGDDVTTFLC